MRIFTVLAVAASAVAEVAHLSQPLEPVATGEVAAQICDKLPTLCTHAVMLKGLETTLTYLCPETESPSVVTITKTATTTATATVTAGPDGAAPPISMPTTSDEPTTTVTLQSTRQVTMTWTITEIPAGISVSLIPGSMPPVLTPPATSDEPTTTVTLQPTSQITRTETVTRVTPSSSKSSSSSLTPASITWSFTAVPPYDIFPTPVSSTADLVSANSTGNSSTSYVFPYHVKYTSPIPHSDYIKPSALYIAHAEANETVTATATPVPTESSNGMAGDGRVSFVALFLGLMAAAFIV
ncbi:hypothetical protein PtrSN002B_009819 [Pyrenophora tritici-repentis]|uniref:Uncharacterized protein n=1 Tax=Pyrenophora tritici-repentis TaxID=45151 RepID=A0A2W1G9H2_9PLEO|nr:hypothetical protein Alg215_07951 [Pyrenophora tritici-repentis]KAI0587906.1 hypothetical protein Alg130_03593 [Pyrenophora tritici-repentis]KAI0612175.1 hypothetical protein TUN205_03543 [Pyrenophora tritici-repentis]KAI0624429.1 hypothetical protein TUN199_03537 [Pyrenophora tritici-repentis]KAI1519547.1 hypothetical protein Ptr86124_002675 [Pyrenophora tritici-repentis]